MIFATTDCVIAACPLATSSYSMVTAWTTRTQLWTRTACVDHISLPSSDLTSIHLCKEIGRNNTLFAKVTGGWGCCCFFSLFLTSTVEGWRIIIFLRTRRPPYCQWQFVKKCKPGLQLAFAQTWSSLSQASFPMPLHQCWAGAEHF